MFAKHHDVAVVQFGVFRALGVVMFDGMKMRWRDLLVCVPRTDVMGSVFRGAHGGGGGGGGDRFDNGGISDSRHIL